MTKQIITKEEYSQDILSLASEYDLILLDLDDVVLTSKQYVCGSQWYHRYYQANKEVLTADELADNIFKCMGASEFTHVSLQLIKDFSELAKNKMVYGLTGRKIAFASETDEHLAEVEMSFSGELPQSDYIQNGIIYVGYAPGTAVVNDKGVLLNGLIQDGFFGDVRTILLIDDLLTNIVNVQKALSDELDFTGVHYTEVHTRLLNQYDENELELMGNTQFSHFMQYGIFLSNDEALA